MSLPPQTNPATAMAMKSRGATTGFSSFAKPLTNFSGIVAEHVFSIVQSLVPAKPAEQFNASVAKALDSLLHVCALVFMLFLFLFFVFIFSFKCGTDCRCLWR